MGWAGAQTSEQETAPSSFPVEIIASYLCFEFHSLLDDILKTCHSSPRAVLLMLVAVMCL